ncbi:MAG TPA: glycosyltransferase [Polyangiaceae bacterium]|nr:glycosyltransferase [Polyangiaceae bacterium]
MNIAFFGSSLVSAYWNGAATYYRGLLAALHARGHRLTFYEPDAYERQQHRDIADPPWARVVVYPAGGPEGLERCLKDARSADLVVKASGVGVFDEELEREVAALRSPSRLVAFWDVDAPATLDRVEKDERDPFRASIPRYDVVFTYGGGPNVVRRYVALGAARCVPVYNAVDPLVHHPAPRDARLEATLGLVANRLPDREARIEEFFTRAARLYPAGCFLIGGNGWDGHDWPENVRAMGHVYTEQHNAFNSTVEVVLNVNRDSMAKAGYSPATRVFEAAGAGACMITDAWEGLSQFLEPGSEILVAHDGAEVVEHLEKLTPEGRQRIGAAARRRVLAEHTYARRAELVDFVLAGSSVAEAS